MSSLAKNESQEAVAEDATLPCECAAETMMESAVESFYSTPPEGNKKQSVPPECGCDLEETRSKEEHSIGKNPPTFFDESEAVKEMEELRALDFEDSQVSAVAAQDQTAPLSGETE